MAKEDTSPSALRRRSWQAFTAGVGVLSTLAYGTALVMSSGRTVDKQDADFAASYHQHMNGPTFKYTLREKENPFATMNAGKGMLEERAYHLAMICKNLNSYSNFNEENCRNPTRDFSYPIQKTGIRTMQMPGDKK